MSMNLERRQIVAAMQSMGWTATREPNRPQWKFTRPDTGGLWDLIRVNQQDLSWDWLRRHDPDFQKLVANLWKGYYPARFAKTIKEVTDET